MSISSSVIKPRAKDGGVEPPISIGGFFGAIGDNDSDNNDHEGAYEEIFEIQVMDIGGLELKIRQSSWHKTNANKVWPGTFALAEFILERGEVYSPHSKILELGSATGALAIFLRKKGFDDIVTSDIDDDGEVQDSVAFNSVHNGLEEGLHIPHTWGSNWEQSVAKSIAERKLKATSPDQLATGTTVESEGCSTSNLISPPSLNFKFIIASDILLYVSAYEALVQTIDEIFAASRRDVHKSNSAGTEDGSNTEEGVQEFLMAWNRRIAESVLFFDLMKEHGYRCHHHGKCIYSFYPPAI